MTKVKDKILESKYIYVFRRFVECSWISGSVQYAFATKTGVRVDRVEIELHQRHT